MMERQDKKIGDFFDECARNRIMDSFTSEEKSKLSLYLKLWDIQPGQYILEPGCGTGRLTTYLARAVGPQGKVYACDLSAEMIHTALCRGLNKQATFLQCPVTMIPTGDNIFDKVICFQVFPHFSDRVSALTEMRRVLKPGGDLWINHCKRREEINTLHRNASGIVVSHQLPSDDEMVLLLTTNGFGVEEISDSSQGYRIHAKKQ